MTICTRCGVGPIPGVRSNLVKVHDGSRTYVHALTSVCEAVARTQTNNARERRLARSWWRRLLVRLALS